MSYNKIELSVPCWEPAVEQPGDRPFMTGERLGKRDLEELRILVRAKPEHVTANYTEHNIPIKSNPSRMLATLEIQNTGKCAGCTEDGFRDCREGFVAQAVRILDRSY